MKPRLGSYVYVITYVDGIPQCITKDKVHMKNKYSFITEDMLYDYVIDEYRTELDFDDDNYGWAKTLKRAKEIVKNHIAYWDKYDTIKHKAVFKKVDGYGWNVEIEREK